MSVYRAPPNRYLVRESRPFDFLYDATYTAPSRADFLASVQHGQRAEARIKVRPVYHAMFSTIKTAPRNVACLEKLRPDVMDNFLPEYDINGVPVIPADTGPLPTPRLIDEPTGADRAKYAIRYGTPMYKTDVKDNDATLEVHKNMLHDAASRTVTRSIQTDYRESESQTDPYSPPYFLPYPGAYPKLLALVKLTWEKGLPFTLEDIVIIERALTKRVMEHSATDIENQEEFEKRIKLMEELEAQQWSEREKELDKLRQRKMDLTNRLLQEYAARVKNDHVLKLEKLHVQLKAKSQETFKAIKHQYFRELRKLEHKYLHKQESRKRDIIKDYTEFDSNVYAPLSRKGVGRDLLGVEPTELTLNLHSFDRLEEIMKDPDFVKEELSFDVEKFRRQVDKCRPTGSVKRLEKKLEDIYESFKGYGSKSREQNMLKRLRDRFGQTRPPTPEIYLAGNREEELRRPHEILLQKIARGRAEQKLIRGEMEAMMDELLALKFLYDIGLVEEEEDEICGLDAVALRKMLRFLDSEMVRLMEERKVHALILLAERERAKKEAEEGGRRFQEDEARRANDEIFKQVTGIHQATVDLYLEEVFLESCDRIADDQARQHVKKMATTLNDALHSARNTLPDLEQEELAADLVSGVMLPELCRLYHQQRIDAAGARFTKASEQVVDAICAAHPVVTKYVFEDIEPIVEEHLIRSTAALDGGVVLVDEIITDAVNVALGPLSTATPKSIAVQQQASRSPSTDSPSIKSQESSGAAKSATSRDSSSKSMKEKASDEDSGEVTKPLETDMALDPSPVVSQSEDIIEADETVAEKSLAAELEEVTVAPTEEMSKDVCEEEEEEMAIPTLSSMQFYVDDEVVRSLAAKSVQVTYGTEFRQEVQQVFTGATRTVDSLFEGVKGRLTTQKDDADGCDAEEVTEEPKKYDFEELIQQEESTVPTTSSVNVDDEPVVDPVPTELDQQDELDEVTPTKEYDSECSDATLSDDPDDQ